MMAAAARSAGPMIFCDGDAYEKVKTTVSARPMGTRMTRAMVCAQRTSYGS